MPKYSRHAQKRYSDLTRCWQFWILVVFPALSFWGSCYMLLQYWMDESSWTLLRKRVMFANIPMCIFFALVLMGQSEYHRMGMDCAQMGSILQVTYLMMNLWHTMTIITAYRFICLEKGRLSSNWQIVVHSVCWGFPIISTVLMTVLYSNFSVKADIEPSIYHEDIFADPDIRGIGESRKLPPNPPMDPGDVRRYLTRPLRRAGWCGVKSSNRVLKAVFVNAPQLIAVSLYAQYYSYIHDYIDPDPDADPSNVSTRVSTSSNAALMGAAEQRKVQYNQDLAKQLRLYMTAYMMSFLTNTVMQVVGDNLAIGDPSDSNLLIQALVVTPQGFFWALVYMKSAPNSLFAAYCNVGIKFFEGRGNASMATKLKGFRDGGKAAAAKAGESGPPGPLMRFKNSLFLFLQSFLMLPVAIWVWTPMEFLAEQLSSRAWIFFGLCIWGTATVFPVYWFSVGQTVASPLYYSFAAQAYVVRFQELSHAFPSVSELGRAHVRSPSPQCCSDTTWVCCGRSSSSSSRRGRCGTTDTRTTSASSRVRSAESASSRPSARATGRNTRISLGVSEFRSFLCVTVCRDSWKICGSLSA